MAISKDHIVPLETAQKWVENWKYFGVNYLKETNLKAFFIPESDLRDVLDEEGVKNVRTYLGIEEKDVNGSVVLTAHLLIVGIDEDGKDMINSEKGWNIYDFTLPCPSTCDTSSLLYIK